MKLSGIASHRFLIALGVSLLLAAVAHAGNGGPRVPRARRELSAAERVSLDSGALVERPMVERRGSLDLMGGTSYQVIDAPLKVVWSALLDTAHYHRMMPSVREARLIEDEPRERTVFMRQGAGPFERAYYLTVRIYEDRGDITFSVDERRPHNVRAAWGFYTVRPYADKSKTLLAYGVMADLDVRGVAGLLRDDVHAWLLKVPWTVKRFVEGSGRYIYREVWGKHLAAQSRG